ncbi:MAG: tRNA lysidine(34) synthetase TilS [Acutalibacteraceae bacterium]
MNDFTNTVRNKFFKAVKNYNMLDGTEDVVVGFSGGADSICLLHLLNSLKDTFGYSLKAVHVNHGIRGDEAKSDEEFAESFCKAHGISFFLVSVDCIAESEKTKESLEECGRRLRYESFNKLSGYKSKIATAHNANDNAETVIFNLTRGTSVKGMSGIPFVRDNIIRPLLYCSRSEIEGYCLENDLRFVTDSTNLGIDYTRNKIRHLVLPVLGEINPSFLDAFSSLSDSAESVSAFLSESAQDLLSRARIGEFIYDRQILLDSHKAVVTQLLCSQFSEYGKISPDNKKINGLYNLLSSGGRFQIYGKYFAEVKKNYLRFYTMPDKADNTYIDIKTLPFEAEIYNFSVKLEKISDNSKIVNQISSRDVIDCNKIFGNLVLRTRKAGDIFTFPKRNVSKSLKKLFNEENIPVELRDCIPVICDDSGVVWVYGFGVTKRCCLSGNSNNIILVGGKNNGGQKYV